MSASKKTNNNKKNNKKKQNLENYAAVIVALLAVVVVIVVVIITSAVTAKRNRGESGQNGGTTPIQVEKDESYAPPEFEISHYAEIDIKDYGKITVGLDSAAAPGTVENFIALANDGFYDALTFHRIMEGFMMQGGDPEGTGFGGSENKIKGEFSANGVDNPLSHVRGAISMARSGNSYDSASSQFFIVHEDSTFLDGQYAAFGYVVEGIEVVDSVCKSARPIDDNGTIAASEQPIINSITIREAEQE